MANLFNIRFRCAQCGGKLSGDARWAGAIVHCSHCAAPTFFPVATPATEGVEAVPEAMLLAVELKGACPSCQGKFRVDSRAMGRRVVCPECGRGMAIPRVPTCPEPLKPAESGPREVEPASAVQAFALTADEVAFLMAPVATGEGEHDPEIDVSPGGRDA